MKFKGETLFFIGIIVISVLVVGGALLFGGSGGDGGSVDTEKLVTKGAHTKGPDDAKVTLVEFADFQCPACAAAFPVIEEIANEYKDKLKFVYRHFPLPSHQHARLAAQSAEAAGEQGKFWEYYSVLYDRQTAWSASSDTRKLFDSYAKELGLNLKKFEETIDANKHLAKINADAKDGESFGVNSTPTFFLNGERMVGVPDKEVLKSKINKILTETKSATSSD